MFQVSPLFGCPLSSFVPSLRLSALFGCPLSWFVRIRITVLFECPLTFSVDRSICRPLVQWTSRLSPSGLPQIRGDFWGHEHLRHGSVLYQRWLTGRRSM